MTNDEYIIWVAFLINENATARAIVYDCLNICDKYYREKERWEDNHVISILSEQQNHKCCYCGISTWIFDKTKVARKKSRKVSKFRLKHLSVECDKLPNMRGDQQATVDHIVPKSFGGTSVKDNLVMSCYSCNINRGNIPAIEFYDLNKTTNGVRFQMVSDKNKTLKNRRDFKEIVGDYIILENRRKRR